MAAVVSNLTSSHDQVLMLEGDEDGLGRERVEWGEEEKRRDRRKERREGGVEGRKEERKHS